MKRNNNWYGIKGITFIWHNEWADPEIEFEGNVLNVHDIEDVMWERYLEEHPECDGDFDKFAEYMRREEEEIKEMFREMVRLYSLLKGKGGEAA